MKILIVHNIFWTSYKACVFTALNKQCMINGDVLTVLHIAEKGAAQRKFGIGDVNKHKYKYKILFEGELEAVSKITMCSKLCLEILRSKPDVILLPGYSELYNWLALVGAMVFKARRLICFDSTERDRKRYVLLELIKRIYIGAFHGGLTYGNKSLEYLQKLGMPRDKISIRCQAIDSVELIVRFTKAREQRCTVKQDLKLKPLNVVFVGRLSAEKNIEFLLRAFSLFKRESSFAIDWGLVIIGDGPLRLSLENICKEIGLVDAMFLGGKSPEEVPDFLALGDVFILPSISEPWGVVVNEAMACGMPVLVSNACGAAYDLVIEGENGFTFDPNNSVELISKLSLIANDSKLIVSMGQRSKEIIQGYTPEIAAKSMYDGITKTVRANMQKQLVSK